ALLWTAFNDAHLDDADLRYATLVRAVLFGAHLVHASLADTNLAFADFGGADLRGVDFRDARLWKALLVDADLQHARNLNLNRYISQLSLSWRKAFLGTEATFLDFLSRDELAKFNLSPEKLLIFHRQTGA